MNKNPFSKKIDPSKHERCWKCGKLFSVTSRSGLTTHCPSCLDSVSPVIGVTTQDLMEMEVYLTAGGLGSFPLP